ncbi:glutathione S-transferase U17-like [Zingiber officinale]|uniref:Glutathione S-transferase n=1 Tax=Zingiber officinale TaxID=94328 RepID=A0A8J5HEQ6_ZINOF|nr:glutathione S-transferase U17-like [Zingiber officinale]KAG6525355.1 hypothetical protein ZIOFF_015311 [Zingiber officinale]
MAEVKLLGKWPCPYVLRARVALQLKKVEYEYLEEELGGKSELLLKSNPVHKKIPVLIHRGRPLCESLIIVQYIDEAWLAAPGLLPASTHDRAFHRFWAAYFDDKLSPLLTRLRNGERGRANEEAAEGVKLLEEAFVRLSEGKGFFGGDEIGYLDITIGCHLGWIRVTERLMGFKLIEEAKVPALAGWAERFCAHEAVQGIMPETEKLMEIFQLAQIHMKRSKR